MEPRISLVTLGVEDLDRARRFYGDRLGWPESSAGNAEVAFFRTGGVVVALYPGRLLAEDARLPPERAPFGGITLAHNVRERHEVDAVLSRAVAAGARLLRPAEDTSWGGRTGYFADPDGHPWEIAWNPHFPLGPDGAIRLPD